MMRLGILIDEIALFAARAFDFDCAAKNLAFA